MPFVTDGSLKASLADVLKQPVGELAPHWEPIVAQANERAYQVLVSALMWRGFTKAQIDQWDGGEQYQRDLGLYYALRRGGAYHGYDEATVESFDVREELSTLLLSINGEYVSPLVGRPGGTASAGPNTAGSVFSWPDPNDPTLGEYTRW